MMKNQKVTKSEVCLADKDMRRILLEDAMRVSKLGGAYSMKDYFNGSTWMTEIVVYWPEEKDILNPPKLP